MNYAVSNIISAIIYGSRFEYDDPEFTAMVDRANETIRLTGSPSVQVQFIFPLGLVVTDIQNIAFTDSI